MPPVSSTVLMPAASASGAMVEKCWRARSSVGAISAAWPPASTTSAIAISATTVLPEPTSPCSSRSIRASPARSRSISASASRCERGQAEGQGGFDLSRGAFRPTAMPCRGRASGCRARSRARAGSRRAHRRRAAATPGSSVRSPPRSRGDAPTEAHRRRQASRAPQRDPARAIPAAPAAARAPPPIAR